ncbi:4Fe-4S dicluster domain-containing protein [bacterium]|nr:4Fe-4S dicluster domain-containing protein [bacterium]
MLWHLFSVLGKGGPLNPEELTAIHENTQRVIYWNVGKNVSYIMYPLALISFIIFAFGIYKHRKLWFQGKALENRNNSIYKRFLDTMKAVFFHKKILKHPAGVMHFLIFWGFAVMVIGTILVGLEADTPLVFLNGTFYKIFSFTLDLFAIFLLVGISIAFYRRVIKKVSYLETDWNDRYALGFLFLSVFLGYGLEALRIAIVTAPFEKVSFIGWYSAIVLQKIGFSIDTMALVHKIFWWIHMVTTMLFIATLPFTKFLHIITGPINIFFKRDYPYGKLKKIDFETIDEDSRFGVSEIQDFSWKDLLDSDACIRCGRCTELCPAHNTEKPLNPKKLIQDIKTYMSDSYSKKNSEIKLIEKRITEEVIWSCTTCAACMVACPMEIEHVDKIVNMRRNLVMGEGKVEPNTAAALKKMDKNGNPWGLPTKERADWIGSLDIPRLDKDKDIEFEILFWVGSMGSYDKRSQKIARAFVDLLKKADIKFAILGNLERATGDSARKIGAEDVFQKLVEHNIKQLDKFGMNKKDNSTKKIVTISPHTFNTIKNEYPDFGGEYNIIHHSVFLNDLLKSGKLVIKEKIDKKLTFHDSCYLGRYSSIYNEPREILNSISKDSIIEMKHNHDNSFCCGAGGGRMWMEEPLGTRINIKRAEEAIDINASTIATACPFCLTMITDGLKAKDKEEDIQVLDIAELLNQVC